MIVIGLFIFGFIILFYLYYTKDKNYWKERGVPIVSGSNWFFGHYKPIVLTERHIGIIFQEFYNEYPEAPFVGYMKFGTPGILIRDPDIIKSILITDFNHFAENEMKVDKKHDILLGNNPFFLHGSEWKTSRSHSTSLTTIAKLKMYWPAIREVNNVMMKYIKSICIEKGMAELETKELSGMYTTDVIANAIFGVNNNTFENRNSLFFQLTSEMFTNGKLDILKLFLTFTHPGLTNYLRIRLSSKRCENVLLALVKQSINNPEGDKTELFKQIKSYRENDKMGVFTDEYIASLCFVFLADGYETSSDVLCFTLFHLAWLSNIQDRLRSEIMNMINETNNYYTIEHVEKLKYLDMVVSEALRLYPPATVTTRLCTMDYTSPDKSLKIKKGTPVSIPQYALQRDEKYYPNPEKFDPERFIDEAVSERHKFVYLPFGEGPRKCLGLRFGLIQVKVCIINILQNFRLKPSAKTNYPVEIDPVIFITRPLNGAWVHFENLT